MLYNCIKFYQVYFSLDSNAAFANPANTHDKDIAL